MKTNSIFYFLFSCFRIHSRFYFLASRFCIVLLFSIFYFLDSASVAQAAVLYLTPSSGQFAPGQTFIVGVGLDTENECVNAAQVDIAFPKDLFKIVDFSRGQSIITYWVKYPESPDIVLANREGRLSFSGGMPGGWCGRIKGDVQGSSYLANIVFQTTGSAQNLPAQINILNTSQVLLNDGKGTGANLALQNAQIEISNSSGAPLDGWSQIVANDKIPPEHFEIKLQKESLIFDGKYFVTFQTSDKQTGIGHYEISEAPLAQKNTQEIWKQGNSPYLLEDQKLRSTIKVKAVDMAGNQTIAELAPVQGRIAKPGYLVYLFGILACLMLAAVIFVKKHRKTLKNE